MTGWPTAMRKGVGAAAAIYNSQGRILLVRHSYGRCNWELPGGGVEAGESPAQAVRREVLEETSLDVDIGRLTGVYSKQDDDSIHFVFACRAAAGSPQPDLKEVTECAFFPLDELPRPISSFTMQRIQDARSPEHGLSLQLVEPLRWEE